MFTGSLVIPAIPPVNKANWSLKTKEEKLNQNRFFFWYKRENRDWIRQRLQKANRPELIEKLLGDQEPKGGKPMPKWLENRRKK